jgi:hypothetical protein
MLNGRPAENSQAEDMVLGRLSGGHLEVSGSGLTHAHRRCMPGGRNH